MHSQETKDKISASRKRRPKKHIIANFVEEFVQKEKQSIAAKIV